MSITNKVTAGLVSIAFVFIAVAMHSTSAQTTLTPAELQAKIDDLIATVNELKSLQGKSYTTVASTGGNAACPYTWTKNLAIGSSGDDVRQLQRFLNGNPQTQVATTGIGSPGHETSYYGPATTRAVSKFQELYAAKILTPLGLTRGTGGFYTSTRNHANSMCQSGSSYGGRTGTPARRADSGSATSPPVVQVTGDALAVTPGNPIGDAYVVQGAQRAPFTSIVLTAGNENVQVQGIRVRRFGLSSSDNFETVALVNANGVQIGAARSLRHNEVKLGGSFTVPANRSVTLAVVGNISNDDEKFSAGSIAGLEVAEVIANTRVQGNFPIRGAAHVLSSSITLQMAKVEVSGGGGYIEFNEDTEVATVTVDLGGNDVDEEDAYLRSIILEQTGTADDEEVGDVEILVDGERANYNLVIDRDRYIINFGGRGVLIEENDNVEIRLETNTDIGYKQTIQFKIDDISDVYIVGASYGYGLPVEIVTGDEETEATTIRSGEVRAGGRLSKFEDEVRYGRDVILGALSVELEGENISMEDLTFEVEIDRFRWESETDNAWEDAEEDLVSFEDVRLRVNGETVASADENIDFEEDELTIKNDKAEPLKVNVDFSDRFTVEVRSGGGETETIFEIVADLDSAWSHFGGTDVVFTLTDVDMAEGERSEKDYTEGKEWFASTREFKEVEIIGNKLAFEISNDGVDGDEFVAGADDVVFGTLEVDASDAIDNIELKNLYISFKVANGELGDLSHLDNCRILDDDDSEVADGNSVDGENTELDKDQDQIDQMKFNFDDYIVRSEESVELNIVCSIGTKAEKDNQYQIVTDPATTGDDRIEYKISRDDREYEFDSSNDYSDIIKVSEGGTLSIKTDSPNDESVIALAIGDGKSDIETLEITFEAEDEDISIETIYLSGLNLGVTAKADGSTFTAISENELKEFIKRITIDFDGSVHAKANEFKSGTIAINEGDVDQTIPERSLAFDVNKVVEIGEKKTVTLTVDYGEVDNRVGRTLSGNWLTATKLHVLYEGESSGKFGYVEKTVGNDFTKNVVFPTVPTISTTRKTQNNDLSGNDVTLYEFTIKADRAGDVYVKQIAVDVTKPGSVTLENAVVKRGSITISNTVSSLVDGEQKFEIKNDEIIYIVAGESRTFSIVADVRAATTDDEVTIELLHDNSRNVAGKEYVATLGNFIWSPSTLGYDDDVSTKNDDWFNGWALFDGDDTHSWTTER